jgi:hypothetical protein
MYHPGAFDCKFRKMQFDCRQLTLTSGALQCTFEAFVIQVYKELCTILPAMSADNSSWWRRRASDNLEGSSGPVQPSSSRVRATPDSSTTSWRSAAGAPVDRASAGRWNTHNSISTSTNAPESQRHNTNTAFASSSSGSDRRFDGAQLTARLRGANTPEKLQVLLEGHASTLSGQQLSAAFK